MTRPCSSAACRRSAATAAVHVVPNGVDLLAPFSPSARDARQLLFMGPFRYPPNLHGIRTFLETVYPALLARVPGVRLVVLGGPGAAQTAAAQSCFRQPGIEVVDAVEDARPWLVRVRRHDQPAEGIRGPASS